MKSMLSPEKARMAQQREAKLAAALRTNLRRRKAAVRDQCCDTVLPAALAVAAQDEQTEPSQ